MMLISIPKRLIKHVNITFLEADWFFREVVENFPESDFVCLKLSFVFFFSEKSAPKDQKEKIEA